MSASHYPISSRDGDYGLTRRLAAIMMTDIVGYSRMMSEDQNRTVSLLRHWRETCLDPQVAAESGRLVKLMGDGALAEFPSVVNAVRCALNMRAVPGVQSSVRSPLNFRTGVAIGDVVVDGDDILGDGINIAARLQAIAEPGWICFSETVYQNIKNVLRESYVDLGRVQLKNIPQAVHVYGVPPSGGSVDRPTVVAQRRRRNRLALGIVPIVNLTDGKISNGFCIGLESDLTTALSRFREIAVRQMVEGQKDGPAGAELDYRLSATLREVGGRLRLNIQLGHLDGAETIWAERYEIDGGMQDEIVARIATEIGVSIANHALSSTAGDNGLALSSQDYVRIAWHAYQSAPITGMLATLAVLKKALKNNPDDAHLLGILSRAYYRAAMTAVKGDRGELEAAMAAVKSHGERAIKLDPSNSDGRIGLAWYYIWRREVTKALHHLDAARDTNPYDQRMIVSRATALTYLGQPAEAMRLVAELASTQQLYIDMKNVIQAEASFFLGDFKGAAQFYDQVSTETKAESHGIVIAAYAAAGRMMEAHAEASAYLDRLAKTWHGTLPRRAEILEWELENCYPLLRLQDVDLLHTHLARGLLGEAPALAGRDDMASPR